jgi:hypothetical protein
LKETVSNVCEKTGEKEKKRTLESVEETRVDESTSAVEVVNWLRGGFV